MEIFLELNQDIYKQRIKNYEKYLAEFFEKLQKADKFYPNAIENEEYMSYVIYNKWPIRKLEYSYIIDKVENIIFDGAKLLEAGCGVSPLPFLWSKLGADVVAIDISEKSLSMLDAFSNDDYFGVHKKIECRLANISGMPFDDNTFDIITSVSVLEHLPYPEYLLAFNEIYRVLKPGGTFICTCDLKAEHKSKFSSLGAFSKDDIKYILECYKEELSSPIDYKVLENITEEKIEKFWENYNYKGSGYTNNRGYTAVGFSYTKMADKIEHKLLSAENLIEQAKRFQEQFSELEQDNIEKEKQIQILNKAAQERLEIIQNISNNSLS